MSSKRYLSILKLFLQLGCGYMVFEALLHGSGIRLMDASEHWPESAVVFARLFVYLWASVSFFVAVVLYFAQRYFDQAKPLIVLMSIPAIIHGLVVLWLSLVPYAELLPTPTLYVWVPFYQWALRAEAASLLFSAGYILYGKWKSSYS